MSETLRDTRLEKLARLRELGVDPFGGRFERTGSIAEVRALFVEGKEKQPTVTAAGRITALRAHGKSAFLVLKDWTATIQVYIKKDLVGEDVFAVYKLLDLGDLLGVTGELFQTRTGELTILVSQLTVLCKALQPPPEKWHGLRDVEIRYRQRYVDLSANDPVMTTFLARSEMMRRTRGFLDERGFIEVETPMMQPIPGGAAAKPFITHHNTLDLDLYLRIAPELYLKRLLVGGMERIYEINRNFRNEGISTRHNPEFTMLEVYQAYGDLSDMMELTESLTVSLAAALAGGMKVTFGEQELDFTPPWPRRTYAALLKEHAGIDLRDEAALVGTARTLGLEIDDRPAIFYADEIFKRRVDPLLVQPCFVTEYPVELCPLTRAKPDDPTVAERFECFIAGLELANAYTELNDPLEQAERLRQQSGEEAERYDADFVMALEYGMPPAGGLGIGIDRLAMVLLNQTSIRDVILFPLLRPEAEAGSPPEEREQEDP